MTIATAVAAAVVLAANLTASAIGPHVSESLYWPTFEVQHKYERMLAVRPPPQIAFFGDSVFDTAVNPSLMGSVCADTCYNASLAGETLAAIGEWATRVVVRRFHPSTVVLGFNPSVLSQPPPGPDALTDEFHASRPIAIAEGRSDVIDRVDSWMHSHVSLYKYRAVLRKPFGDPAAGAAGAIYNPPLSAAGWNSDFTQLKLSSLLAAEAAGAPLDNPLTSYVESVAKLHALGQLITQLRREGATVVFVALPVPQAYIDTIAGGRPAYAKAVTDMTAQARSSGATVFAGGVWPTALFADRVHLNGTGTARFCAWLSTRLARMT